GQIIHKIDTEKMEPTTSIKQDIKDLIDALISTLIDFHIKKQIEGKDLEIRNQHIFECFKSQNVTLHEAYNWLLNNQNDSNSNSIYLLGYFNYHGIETSADKQKAF